MKLTKAQEKEIEKALIKLGDRVVLLRKKKKLSQKDLAYKIGWDKPNLRKIEHGRSNVTFKTLFLLAEGLEVSIQELLDV